MRSDYIEVIPLSLRFRLQTDPNDPNLRHTALTVSIETPPTWYLNHLFLRGSQSAQSWLKGKEAKRRSLLQTVNKLQVCTRAQHENKRVCKSCKASLAEWK